MSEQDPIDKLSRFGAGFSSGTGGDMPLSPADVRRRGDQIRRRRTALVAGASALAVAAVAVPIFAVVGGNPKAGDNDNLADDPRGALSTDDLLRDVDTEYFPNEKAAFRTTDTYEGDGQATFHPCQQATLASLGATTSFTRTFDYVVDPAAGDVVDATYDGLVETVAEFEDEDAARSAYDTFAQWIVDCESRLGDFERVNVVPQAREVQLPAGAGDALIYDLSWGPVEKAVDPYGDASYINETGLVLRGDRIAVVGLTIVGQDYNFLDEDGGTPVNRMVPVAADRLRPGGDAPTQPAETLTEPAGTVNPAIADTFPLTSRWPDASEAEDGDGIDGPARNLEPLSLTACDTTLPDAPHADRLLARWTNVEDYRARQLTTYATVEDAIVATAEIQKLYMDCPEGETREDGFTPKWAVREGEVGDESFAVLGWDELDGQPTTFGETLLVVRAGLSVLVVAHSGHSGNPQGREDVIVDEISTESADVIAQMCAFTEAGC